MGDRGNVIVTGNGKHNIYLYTHWRGSELDDIVREVLRREERWGDAPYLTRMIFSAMIKGKEGESTGYGISTAPQDSNREDIEVDCLRQEVDGVPFKDYIKGDAT